MPPQRKALVVGVNYAGGEAELRGPANDALRWLEVLTSSCGFPREGVLAMIDEYPSGKLVPDDDPTYPRPTEENILEGLEWLVQDAAQGDVLLFAFSGHAAQLPDAVQLDPDARLEEGLCPVDWDSWGITPYRIITDDTLHQYFARLPAGVLLTVVIDSCIAGVGVKAPLRINFELPDREVDNMPLSQGDFQDLEFDCDAWLRSAHVNALPRRLPRQPTKPLWSRLAKLLTRELTPPLNEGLAVFCFTACAGAQTALDAWLEGLPQGCMSYCLQQALELLNFRCTYLELGEAMDHIARNLRREVMPCMDQYFQLSYGKNAGPDECLVFDGGSAFVAKDKAKRRRGQARRPA